MKDQIDKVKEALKEGGNTPDVFIEQAKAIACIAFDSFNEDLLDRALDIARAVAKFAHEIEKISV